MNFQLPTILKSTAKDIFSDAFPLIQKYAPTIGAALGGGPGFAIGALLPILGNAFNAHPGDIKTLVSNIVNDPDAQAKLEQIEHEHSGWVCAMTDSVDRLTSAEVNIKLSWADPK